MDSGFAFQQNLGDRRISVLALRAVSNRYDDLRPLMPEILTALDSLGEGQFVRIGG